METINNAANIKHMEITRIFGAPRELVFALWTDAKHVQQWWAPRMFTNPRVEIDARPGGKMRIDMLGPDGVIYPDTGVFEEVVPPERLVFTSSAIEDADGNPQLVVRNVVTFEDFNGMTLMTMKAEVLKASPEAAFALMGMEQGWSESLYKLSEYIDQVNRVPVQPAEKFADLKTLQPLVGTWQVTGGAEGTTRYEWMDGGYFLIQYYDFQHDGHPVKGIEVIGHEQAFGAEPSADLKSRIYDNSGKTFDYVYELNGKTLMIWAGGKGSPAYFEGTFNDDFSVATGAWHYPDGGGYDSTMTRIN